MNKEFIPYEQALELKELGFDEPCFRYNYLDISLFECFIKNTKNKESDSILLVKNSELPSSNYTLPLYQQAFRWFREKYQLYQAVYADKRADDLTLLYKVHVYKLDEELSEYAYRWAKTYEEAEQACLDKLIELVKEKK